MEISVFQTFSMYACQNGLKRMIFRNDKMQKNRYFHVWINEYSEFFRLKKYVYIFFGCGNGGGCSPPPPSLFVDM